MQAFWSSQSIGASTHEPSSGAQEAMWHASEAVQVLVRFVQVCVAGSHVSTVHALLSLHSASAVQQPSIGAP